jgi:hypothetical protein
MQSNFELSQWGPIILPGGRRPPVPPSSYVIAGVAADLDPPQNGPPGPNPLANMDRGVHIR